jgi:hypothetical protein
MRKSISAFDGDRFGRFPLPDWYHTFVSVKILSLPSIPIQLEHGYLRGRRLVNTAAIHAAATAAAAGSQQSKLGSIFSGIYGGSSTVSQQPGAGVMSSLTSSTTSPLPNGNGNSSSSSQSSSAANSSSKQSKTLMDLVVETISKCSDEYDDNVQIQVIKALLTAITSLHCEVREEINHSSILNPRSNLIVRPYTGSRRLSPTRREGLLPYPSDQQESHQ